MMAPQGSTSGVGACRGVSFDNRYGAAEKRTEA
jgi:hypothetical protein